MCLCFQIMWVLKSISGWDGWEEYTFSIGCYCMYCMNNTVKRCVLCTYDDNVLEKLPAIQIMLRIRSSASALHYIHPFLNPLRPLSALYCIFDRVQKWTESCQ